MAATYPLATLTMFEDLATDAIYWAPMVSNR
jgi:hypothetical protein